MKKATAAIVIFLVVLSAVSASLFRKKLYEDPKYKLDNPADSKSPATYQGYRTESKAQSFVILNESQVTNVINNTNLVIMSNYGWKPLQYKVGLSVPAAESAGWVDMPASRTFSYMLPYAPGTYPITVLFKLPDNTTATVTSNVLYVANDPAPSNVVMITPGDDSSYYYVGSTNAIWALAQDDGSISKVEFYTNGGLIGLGTAFGDYYSYNWIPNIMGAYSLYARAYDNYNVPKNSLPRTIRVRGYSNSKPVVTVPVAYVTTYVPPFITNTVSVIASASDNDTPLSNLTYIWSKKSDGNATYVALSSTNTSNTTVTMAYANIATEGINNVLLQLIVSDGIDAVTNEVLMSIKGTLNLPPDVKADISNGTYRVVNASSVPVSNVQLYGYAKDYESATTTVVWTNLSGPGTVTFVSNTNTNTMVHFSANGVYELSLLASDGTTNASNSVIVTVNLPPSITITNSILMAMPTLSTNLIAIVSDDGYPTNAVMTYIWKKETAPSNTMVTFAPTASNTNTTVTFSENGSYVISFEANDGATNVKKTISVNIGYIPTIAVTQPANGSAVGAGTNITVTAVAGDGDGLSTISTVEFYTNGVLYVSTNVNGTSNYSCAISNLEEANHQIYARVIDQSGFSSYSPTNTVSVVGIPAITNLGSNLLGAVWNNERFDILFSRNVYWPDAVITMSMRGTSFMDSNVSAASNVTITTNNNMIRLSNASLFATVDEHGKYYSVSISNVKVASNGLPMQPVTVHFAAYKQGTYSGAYRDTMGGNAPGDMQVTAYFIFSTNRSDGSRDTYFVNRNIATTTSSASNFTFTTVPSNSDFMMCIVGQASVSGYASTWSIVRPNSFDSNTYLYARNNAAFFSGVASDSGVVYASASRLNVKTVPLASPATGVTYKYSGQFYGSSAIYTSPTNSREFYAYKSSTGLGDAVRFTYGGNYVPQTVSGHFFPKSNATPYNYFLGGSDFSGIKTNIPSSTMYAHVQISNAVLSAPQISRLEVYSNGVDVTTSYPIAVANLDNDSNRNLVSNGVNTYHLDNITFEKYTNLALPGAPYKVYAELEDKNTHSMFTNTFANVSALLPMQLTNGWGTVEMPMGVSSTNIDGWMPVIGTLNLSNNDKFGYYAAVLIFFAPTNFSANGSDLITYGLVNIAVTNASASAFSCWVDPAYAVTNAYVGFIIDRDGSITGFDNSNDISMGTNFFGPFTVASNLDIGSQWLPFTNYAPTATLISPSNGTAYSNGAAIPLIASVYDPNGLHDITNVKFYTNGALLASVSGSLIAAYTNNWTVAGITNYAICHQHGNGV
ncbi:MAG: Ig-like domain-containing protein [Spirochaetes bacterium]|nr:Ig-like domain-containing protein [Spirochaetota bacterium]